MKTLVIDGNNFSNYEELCKEFNKTVFVGCYNQWTTGNLDGFNDLLREVDCTIIWKNFAQSKKNLSYSETVKYLKEILEHCHPSNRINVSQKIQRAESGAGPTILDWVLEIIAEHDNVILKLE